MRPLVSGVFGRWTEMRSARSSSSSRVTSSMPSWAARAGGDVGVVGDDRGSRTRPAAREQLADPAEPDDADRLAEDLDTVELAALPVCSRRVWSAAGIWRAAASISATACSAAVWMLEVGALTTRTPRSVAAGTSTLSRPTPARATILSFLAAASTSASTVVADRTSSASASAHGGEQRRLVGTVHPPDLDPVTECVDRRIRELVGNQNDGAAYLGHVRNSMVEGSSDAPA